MTAAVPKNQWRLKPEASYKDKTPLARGIVTGEMVPMFPQNMAEYLVGLSSAVLCVSILVVVAAVSSIFIIRYVASPWWWWWWCYCCCCCYYYYPLLPPTTTNSLTHLTSL